MIYSTVKRLSGLRVLSTGRQEVLFDRKKKPEWRRNSLNMFLKTCFGTLFVFLTTVKAAPKPTPTGQVSPSSSPPDSEVELFLEKELQKINKYRLMHAATPLQLSLDLTNKAELWATQLANEDKEKIDVNSKYGQNIFSAKEANGAASKSVQSWYNAIRFYDFHSAKGSLKSAYFTQLVWVGSKTVGIGKAKSASGKTYIVALFDPPGNKGNYLHNVLPVTGSGVGKIGPSNCPNGYQLYNNVCYKFFPGPVNWVQASEKCAAQFSTLASINSEAEDIFVKTLLTSGGVSDAWIGVSDVNNHGIMAWLDGSEPNFMNWDYFQNHFPGRKCGVISTNFNWKYKPCYGARGFVCKKPLRGITEYLVILRYENKLWTDNLYYPGSTRYQALSRHIQEAFLDVFGDYDWFEQVTLDHFSKGEGEKILAYVKLRFTPDDDSPADPIQLLRNSIQGSDSPKRSSITGILHGEKVQLVNATMIAEEQTPGSCPSYCVSSQCTPTACNPWCCDPFGQQFFQNSVGAQQPRVSQQQPGYNVFGSAQPQYIPPNQVPAYPSQTAYQVAQQPQFRLQQQPQYQVPPRPQPYQFPVQPPPPQYQYPAPPRPLQYPGYQPQPPPQQFQNPVLRPQPYPFTVPAQSQQYRYQVPPRPQTLPSQQYLILPTQPQPLHQAPQPYQVIQRPAYPQPWPVYPQPQPIFQQPMPQLFQMNQNAKDKQRLQGSKVEQGQAKSPVQLQGVVFSYPYTVPAPVLAPVPPYIPQQYHQPTLQHPKQEAHGKEKGNESEKESEREKSHAKSQVKPLSVALPQTGYPFVGFPPQPYVPSYPYPTPSSQTAWKVRIYRPVLTIARPPPPPVFTPGYPLLNVQQPGYQPYPIPAQPYHHPPQPASPGLLPIGQRKEFQPMSPPPPAYPVQQPLPVTPYRPPYPYFNHYPFGQVPQSAPLDRK